ncbi:MAG: DUF1552 domain-containing protein [Deltaproteobacteria bacterium]|nr:DUF1552 domain-containing protein [Deltaproteobacteria bacterium]
MKSIQLSRRAALRSGGVTMALPFLEAMLPRRAGAEIAPPPPRFIVFFQPNGSNQKVWVPATTGHDYTLSRTLAPLAPVKDKINVLSNLTVVDADVAIGHEFALPAMLTATKERINGETTSIDQVIADTYAGQTRFPSLQVAAPLDSQDCSIDAPTMSIRKGVIQPVICNAKQLFDRVFQESVKPGIDKATRYRQSVLGVVGLRAKDLRQRLGKADQLRMDEYLESVSSIERRLVSGGDASCPIAKPPGVLPTDRSAYFKLMMDVSLLALRCDRTRVLAFQSGFGESTWEFDGKKLNQHGDIAHHDNRPENLEYAHRVDLWHVEHFSTLLQQLDAVVEPGGTMLDNSVALFINEFGDGNAHSSDSIPIILAGRAGGKISAGRHIHFPPSAVPGKGRTTGDLFLSILRTFGVERSTFGTWGTKPLAEIA